jgi:hypothetical protein
MFDLLYLNFLELENIALIANFEYKYLIHKRNIFKNKRDLTYTIRVLLKNCTKKYQNSI